MQGGCWEEATEKEISRKGAAWKETSRRRLIPVKNFGLSVGILSQDPRWQELLRLVEAWSMLRLDIL